MRVFCSAYCVSTRLRSSGAVLAALSGAAEPAQDDHATVADLLARAGPLPSGSLAIRQPGELTCE